MAGTNIACGTTDCTIGRVARKVSALTVDAVSGIHELRRGRYSVICKGDSDVVGPVVIKTYDRVNLVPKKQKMATREAIMMKYLDSQRVPSIPHMWSAYATGDKFHIIMEYCQGGNLLEHLQEAGGPMTEQQLAIAVAPPLLKSLAAMHAAGVTHRDVKLENIFLDAYGRPKLGDFDLAIFQHEGPARAPVGTIFYMAPEVVLLASYKGSGLEAAVQQRVTEKMDVWSLGVCIFELATGYKPFHGVSYEQIASAVIQHAMADLPSHLSPAFRSFIEAALTYNPAARPSAEQLLEHSWIQVHCPSAPRSDSACSLTDVAAKPGKACSSQAAVAAKHSPPAAAAARYYRWQQLQPAAGSASSIHGSSACSFATGSGSSCHNSHSSRGNAILRASKELYEDNCVLRCGACVAGPAATGIFTVPSGGGGVAAAAAEQCVSHVWVQQQEQQRHDAGKSNGAAAATEALISQAVQLLPGLHARSSLGTQADWSTQDGAATLCSPHSIMARIGLNSSSTLGRQLMPWGSGGNHSMHSCSPACAGKPAVSGTTGAPGGLPLNAIASNASLRQAAISPQSSGSNAVTPGQCYVTVGTDKAQQAGQQQQQQQQQFAGKGDSSAAPASAADSPSSGSQRAPQHQQQQQLQQQQPRPTTASSSDRPSSSSSTSNTPRAPATPDAAAAAAAAAASSGLSPIALAVAAAVAEHNKKQPRMWTPFALRVHQLRVAQVLLAERQRQVALNQSNPAPPAEPLVRLQPLRLPNSPRGEQQLDVQQQQQHDGQARPEQQQQQHKAQQQQQQQEPGLQPRQEQQQQQPPVAASATPMQQEAMGTTLQGDRAPTADSTALPTSQLAQAAKTADAGDQPAATAAAALAGAAAPVVATIPGRVVTTEAPSPRAAAAAAARAPAATPMAAVTPAVQQPAVVGAPKAAEAPSPAQQPARVHPAAAEVASSTADNGMMARPVMHQMQQQLSVGRPATGSSSSSSSSKPQKPVKKKWLACFVPRVFD